MALVDLRERADPPVTETLLLDSDDPTTLLIPAGVAHGFFAVTDVNMIYFVTHLYDPNDEYGVAWNDPQLTIPWLADTPILSDRDEANPQLSWDTIPAFS